MILRCAGTTKQGLYQTASDWTPLRTTTERHEERVPGVDDERISTTKLIPKNMVIVFNNNNIIAIY